METYRIEVGHIHQVKPTNIVGAIANEGGLNSSVIGRIEIFAEHSTVDLRAGLPRKIFDSLRQVKIGGRRLNISRVGEESVTVEERDDARPSLAEAAKPAPPIERPTPPKPAPLAAHAKHHGEAKADKPADRKARPTPKLKPKAKLKRAAARS
jgi:ATP-dependent RNA helicase DeaD